MVVYNLCPEHNLCVDYSVEILLSGRWTLTDHHFSKQNLCVKIAPCVLLSVNFTSFFHYVQKSFLLAYFCSVPFSKAAGTHLSATALWGKWLTRRCRYVQTDCISKAFFALISTASCDSFNRAKSVVPATSRPRQGRWLCWPKRTFATLEICLH